MSRSVKHTILLILSLFILITLIGCMNKNNSKDTFSIEQFQSEMKSRSYSVKMQDVEQDFLPTIRKRMLLEDEVFL